MEERQEEVKEEIKSDPHLWHKIECMLFVGATPSLHRACARVDLPMQKLRASFRDGIFLSGEGRVCSCWSPATQRSL
jgi:hypothetical protein